MMVVTVVMIKYNTRKDRQQTISTWICNKELKKALQAKGDSYN